MKERYLSKTPNVTFVYLSKCNTKLPDIFGNSKKRFLCTFYWSAIIYLESTCSTLQWPLDWEWTKAGGDNANDEESCGPSLWYFLQSKGSKELEFLSTVIAAKTMNVVFFLRKLVLSINICRYSAQQGTVCHSSEQYVHIKIKIMRKSDQHLGGAAHAIH